MPNLSVSSSWMKTFFLTSSRFSDLEKSIYTLLIFVPPPFLYPANKSSGMFEQVPVEKDADYSDDYEHHQPPYKATLQVGQNHIQESAPGLVHDIFLAKMIEDVGKSYTD